MSDTNTASELNPTQDDFATLLEQSFAEDNPVEGSVVEGRTGTFVTGTSDAEVVAGFADTFARFDSGHYDPAAIRAHAETFSREAFRRNMVDVVTSTVEGRAR